MVVVVPSAWPYREAECAHVPTTSTWTRTMSHALTLQVKRSPSGAEMMSFSAGTGAAYEPIGFVMEMMTV